MGRKKVSPLMACEIAEHSKPLSEKPKHSAIGASSRYRWANCPGSVKLSEGMPNKSGLAAQEGTAAHEIVALALSRAFSENISTREILAKTIEALHVYTDYCESLKKPGVITHIEHKFDMSKLVFPGLYGTGDFIAYDPATKILHVVDYKHGEALVVEVEHNLQLEYYGLGALVTLGYPCAYVQMTIVQPRAYHPSGPIRSWRVPSLYFLEVEANIVAEAKETRKAKALLLSGTQCMFCPAKTICPQKHKTAVGDAKGDFEPTSKTAKKHTKKQHSFYTNPAQDFEPVVSTGPNNHESGDVDSSKAPKSTSSLFD